MEGFLDHLIELKKRKRYKCDPNEEDCTELVDVEFKEYAVNNLGWSALFKIVVPDIVAAIMFYVHYSENNVKEFEYCDDDSDDEDCSVPIRNGKRRSWYRQFKEWWETNKFSQHTWAWMVVGLSMGWLYTGHFFMFLLWKLFGWIPSW